MNGINEFLIKNQDNNNAEHNYILEDENSNIKELSQSVQDELNLDLREKILLSENTMPGLFISIMTKSGKPISENELYDCVLPRANDLRKPDGSKYKDNIQKVIKSTLCCSGIFEKVDKEKKLWFYKENDALHYLNRNAEKTLNKKIEKIKKPISDEKEVNDFITNQNNLLGKKIKKSLSLRNNNLKYIKANNILNDLLSKYRNNKEAWKKLKNPFNNCQSGMDLVKKLHGNENRIFGMLSAYKFFRPLINKMIKLLHLRKNTKKLEINKLNVKMDDLQNRLELFQQMFAKIDPNDLQGDPHNEINLG